MTTKQIKALVSKRCEQAEKVIDENMGKYDGYAFKCGVLTSTIEGICEELGVDFKFKRDTAA